MSPVSRRILIVLLLLGGLVCVRLGFWQLSRLRERRAANRIALQAREAPAVRLPDDPGQAGDLLRRRVIAVGRYDRANEIVLRGQTMGGVPGVHIVTPLRLEGSDTALLVNRGFVPAADALTPDTVGLAEEGQREVAGIALPITAGGGRPVTRGGRVTWARLDRPALETHLPFPIYPVYLRQSPESAAARFPRRLAEPQLDDGPHLAYAVQWFLFGGMSVGFALLVVGRRGPPVIRAPS